MVGLADPFQECSGALADDLQELEVLVAELLRFGRIGNLDHTHDSLLSLIVFA